MSNLSEYTEFAIQTAREAGNLLIKNYGEMHKLEWKLRTNFKIEVDDLSDRLIRKRINDKFPSHGINSEEGKDKIGRYDFVWVVDPLDGTIPYTYGVNDHFGVCIALVSQGSPIVGVTFAPLRRELYVAEQGKGEFCNGSPIKV